MKNVIIHILGFQGTGKSTIAQEICKIADVKLVDNHSVFSPVMRLIEEDGVTPLPQQVWDNIGKIWEAVFDTITHLSPPEYNFVITNSLLDGSPEHHECVEKWQRCADHRKGHYVPVRLLISVEENERRITMAERKLRQKEINPETPKKNAKNHTVLQINHPNEITLDVTDLSAHEVAQTILAHAKSL